MMTDKTFQINQKVSVALQMMTFIMLLLIITENCLTVPYYIIMSY